MKRADVFQSKYLKAEDLPHAVTVTIQCTNMEDITNSQTNKTEQKAVVFFHGKDKGLVLNQVNWTSIEEQWGDETDGWPGRQITLFATTTPFGNKIVPCIRIKPGVPAAVAQAETFIQQQIGAPRIAQTVPEQPSPAVTHVDDSDVPF